MNGMPANSKEPVVYKLPWGSYAKIARRMRPQVTIQHVREVALGRRRSARVERAIQKYAEQLKAVA